MEVVLIENVDNLGRRGEKVKVADGYGRNHLLPRKLAVAATPQNLRWIEQQRQRFLKQEAKERGEAEELSQIVSGTELTFTRKAGEHGALFGSVTAMDIAAALAAHGYNIDRRKIHLPSPLKSIGSHDVAIRLHRDVTASIKVRVEGEAPPEGAPAEAPSASAAPPQPAPEASREPQEKQEE